MRRHTLTPRAARTVSTLEGLEPRRLFADVNIADFGARPNDGQDDTGAIRAALNASRAGDTLNFAPGEYTIRDTIEMRSNRELRGWGGATLKRDGEGFIFRHDDANYNITYTDLTFDRGGINVSPDTTGQHVLIRGCTFRSIQGGWPIGDAIFAPSGLRGSKITRSDFRDIDGDNGIYGFNTFDNVEISHNTFDNVWEGIHLAYENGGENLNISYNSFKHTTRMAVELQGRRGRNTLLEGNRASEWINNYHGSFFFSITNLTDGVTIRNNHASSGKFGEIDPKAKDTPVGIEVSGRNVTVENNIIENFREGLHAMNIRDAAIRNNRFYNQTWMAIWRTGVNVDDFRGQNLTIESNEIYNPKVTAFLFHGGTTGKIAGNRVYLFHDATEYTEGSGGAYNGVDRPGNIIERKSGDPHPFHG